MASIIFAPRTMSDLAEIHDYIAQDSPAAAEHLILEIERKVLLLGENPLLGIRKDLIRSGVRCLFHNNYIIYYSCEADEVEVLRVLHGARLITRRLFKED